LERGGPDPDFKPWSSEQQAKRSSLRKAHKLLPHPYDKDDGLCLACISMGKEAEITAISYEALVDGTLDLPLDVWHAHDGRGKGYPGYKLLKSAEDVIAISSEGLIEGTLELQLSLCPLRF
jgi:hypothetical protein